MNAIVLVPGCDRVILTLSGRILLIKAQLGCEACRDLPDIADSALVLIRLVLGEETGVKSCPRDRVISRSRTVIFKRIALSCRRDHTSEPRAQDVALDISNVESSNGPIGVSDLPLQVRTCLSRCPLITGMIQVVGDRSDQARLDFDSRSILVQILSSLSVV